MSIKNSIWQINIASLKGIRINLHASFILLLAWVSLEQSFNEQSLSAQALLSAGFLAALMIHEFIHFIVGMIYGLKISSLTLYPCGSLATFKNKMKLAPELIYHLSAPVVNFAIAYYLWSASEMTNLLEADLNKPFLSVFFLSNLYIGLINLVPVIPFDGSRIMKALLQISQKGNSNLLHSQVNQVLTFSLAGASIIYGNPLLAVVSVLMGLSALREHLNIKTAEAAKGLKAKDAMVRKEDLKILGHGLTLGSAINHVVRSFQQVFPVTHNEQMIGILERDHFMRSLASGQQDDYISTLMERDFLKISESLDLTEALEQVSNSQAGFAAVYNDEGDFTGIIIREKALEFLLLDKMFQDTRNNLENSDFF